MYDIPIIATLCRACEIILTTLVSTNNRDPSPNGNANGDVFKTRSSVCNSSETWKICGNGA